MADYSMSRDASPPVRLFNVPPLARLTLLLWFRWPSLFMFMFCIALIAFFAILTRMGITAAVLGQKLVHRLRGTRISGRPWWYRNFF